MDFTTRRFPNAEPHQPYVARCQAEVDGRQCKNDAKLGTPPDFTDGQLWCRQHSQINKLKKEMFGYGNR